MDHSFVLVVPAWGYTVLLLPMFSIHAFCPCILTKEGLKGLWVSGNVNG